MPWIFWSLEVKTKRLRLSFEFQTAFRTKLAGIQEVLVKHCGPNLGVEAN